MKTKTDTGEPISPSRLLEMLEFRFGAFKVIAYAATELAEKDSEFCPPMDEPTAWAIMEFGNDLQQAYEASLEWFEANGCGVRSVREEGSDQTGMSPRMRHDDRPALDLMLHVIERSLDTVPYEAKPHAWRTILAMFADIFERAGVPVPDWVRIGQERRGRLWLAPLIPGGINTRHISQHVACAPAQAAPRGHGSA